MLKGRTAGTVALLVCSAFLLQGAGGGAAVTVKEKGFWQKTLERIFSSKTAPIVSTTAWPDQAHAPANEPSYVDNELLVHFKKGVIAWPVGATQLEGVDKILGVIQQESVRSILKSRNIQLMRPLYKAAIQKRHPHLGERYKIVFQKGDLPAIRRALQRTGFIYKTSLNHLRRLDTAPSDYSAQRQWHHAQIQAPEAWEIQRGLSEVVVAVIDTGIDYQHFDLADNVWTNGRELNGALGVDDDGNGYVDDVRGYNFTLGSPDPMDTRGHGTEVAGAIAALADNTPPDASFDNIVGTAPGLKVMALNTASATSLTHVASDAVVEAILYAADNGARVINMSFGSLGDNAEERDAIDTAYGHGVVLVAAAGNDGVRAERYPAAYPNVIAVAATDQSDMKASFSQFGSWVDLSAPGAGILTTTLANGHGLASGTSVAAPIVSAVAGLVLSQDPMRTVDQVRTMLLSTADDINGVNPRYIGELGAGRVNAYATLTGQPVVRIMLRGLNLEHFNPGELATLSVTLENVGGLDLSGSSASLTTSNPHIVLRRGTAVLGDIRSGTSVNNQTTPFELEVSPQSPFGTVVSFDLTITGNNGGYSVTLPFSLTPVGFEPGWPVHTRASAGQEPAFINVDDDPELEIFSGPSLDTDGTLIAWGYTGGHADGSDYPALADTDLDGISEVANVVTPEGRASIGEIIGDSWGRYSGSYWPAVINGFSRSYAAPTLADLDGDGRLNLLVHSTDGQFYVFNPDGTPSGLPWPLDLGTNPAASLQSLVSPTICDLDQNGSQELIIPAERKLIVLDRSGNSLWSPEQSEAFFTTHYGEIAGPAVAGDIDGNRNLEIIVAIGDYVGSSRVTRLYALSFQGDILPGWPKTLSDGNSQADINMALGDLDADGSLEIITYLPTLDLIYAYHHDGSLVTGWPVRTQHTDQGDHSGLADLLVGNIDRDPQPEIIAGLHEGYLFAFNADGSAVSGWPIHLPIGEGWGRMALGDPDLDGRTELVLTITWPNDTYLFDLGEATYRSDQMWWPRARRDNRNSGCIPVPPLVTYTISGHVAEEGSGVSVNGVRLSLINAADSTLSLSTTTDMEGNYAFLEVPPGRYELTPNRRGMHFFAPGTSEESRTYLPLSANQTHQDFVAVREEYEISGRLTEEGTGSPIAGVELILYGRTEDNDSVLWTTRSDADGGFVFHRIPLGYLTLQPENTDYLFHVTGGTETARFYQPLERSLGAQDFVGIRRDDDGDDVSNGEDCDPRDRTIGRNHVRSCYTGLAGTVGVGLCHSGTETCTNGVYASCTGQVTPATEVCGNGIDEDCNGSDAACPPVDGDGDGVPDAEDCAPADPLIGRNSTRACYTGAPATRGIGFCTDGTESCTNGVFSGVCAGETLPVAEVCGNGIDEDCDDRDLACPEVPEDLTPDLRLYISNADQENWSPLTELNFGVVDCKIPYKKRVRLENVGLAPLQVTAVDNPLVPDLSINNQPTATRPIQLAAGQSEETQITLNLGGDGQYCTCTSRAGEIAIHSNDPDEAVKRVPVRWDCAQRSSIEAEPARLSFYVRFIRSGINPVKYVTVTNQGSRAIRVSSVRLVIADGIFSVSPTNGRHLPSGQSVRYRVEFRPNRSGRFENTLKITTREAGILTIPVTGRYSPPLIRGTMRPLPRD